MQTTNTTGSNLSIQFLGVTEFQHEQEVVVENSTIATKSAQRNPFIRFIFFLFFFGQILAVMIPVVGVALIFSGNLNIVKTAGFNTAVFLGSVWSISFAGYAACFAPSTRYLFWSFALIASGSPFAAIWAYYVFGVVAAVFYGIQSLHSTLLCLASLDQKMFLNVCLLPIENKVLELWFACWRLFLIVATPVIAKFFQDGQADQVPFFAIQLFCLGLNLVCINNRTASSIDSTSGSIEIITKLPIKTTLLLYSPIIGIWTVFAVLYIIELSNSAAYVSDAVISVLLAVGVGFSFFTSYASSAFIAGRYELRFYTKDMSEKYIAAVQRGLELFEGRRSSSV